MIFMLQFKRDKRGMISDIKKTHKGKFPLISLNDSFQS